MPRYKITPRRSRLSFEARSSLHPIKAEATGVGGFVEAELNPGGLDLKVTPQGKLEVDVDSIKTGNMLYDRELERQLEVRKYPRIRGEIVEVTELEAGHRYKIRGNLSVHGVTKPVEGEVKLRVLDDGSFEAEGEQTFDIRDFGLTPPRILMLKVYPDVKVRAHIMGQKQS
jgi:polyisoprenoid-binding protein YceI